MAYGGDSIWSTLTSELFILDLCAEVMALLCQWSYIWNSLFMHDVQNSKATVANYSQASLPTNFLYQLNSRQITN